MISNERIRTVLETSDEDQRMRIRVLNQAVAETLKAYRSKYSTANLRSWRAAEKELGDYLDQIQADGEDQASDETLPNLAKVLVYLQRSGWKVAQSTLYKHQKLGFIKPDQKGRFPVKKIEAYAAAYLKRLDGSNASEDKILKRKQEADARKAQAQAEHWELKTKIDSGLYVPRDLFDRELAGRASVLKSDLLTFCRTTAPEIVTLVKGDPELVPDLIQFLTEQVLAALHRYARDPDPEALTA